MLFLRRVNQEDGIRQVPQAGCAGRHHVRRVHRVYSQDIPRYVSLSHPSRGSLSPLKRKKQATDIHIAYSGLFTTSSETIPRSCLRLISVPIPEVWKGVGSVLSSNLPGGVFRIVLGRSRVRRSAWVFKRLSSHGLRSHSRLFRSARTEIISFFIYQSDFES